MPFVAVKGTHPLRGKRVVVTRARSLGHSFQDRLHQVGATPVSIPALEIAPAFSLSKDSLLSDLAWCNWLMLPSPSVISLWAHEPTLRTATGKETRIATMGKPSAKAYEEGTGLGPSFVHDWSNPVSLAAQLGLGQTDRLLVLGSNRGPGPALAELLAQHSNSRFQPVIQVSCSRALARDLLVLAKGFDAITFTSVSGIRCFMQALQQEWSHGPCAGSACWACIGRSTAAALEEYGIAAQVVCQNPSEADMIAGMSDWFAKQCAFHGGGADV